MLWSNVITTPAVRGLVLVLLLLLLVVVVVVLLLVLGCCCCMLPASDVCCCCQLHLPTLRGQHCQQRVPCGSVTARAVNGGSISPRDCAQRASQLQVGTDLGHFYCVLIPPADLAIWSCRARCCCCFTVFGKCVDAPADIEFAIAHGSSDHRQPMMDIEHTKRLLGYSPQDGTRFGPELSKL